jgi:hypothetical protein
MYISETEALNATHERWCQSKEPITEPVHWLTTVYLFNFTSLDNYLIRLKILCPQKNFPTLATSLLCICLRLV